MEFLVLAPPVCTPAEPPSGAFMLAAGLAGRGLDTGFLDLSLEFFHRVLEDREIPGPNTRPSLEYLTRTHQGYTPFEHRSAVGTLHARLAGFPKKHPGWKLTLMDVRSPGRIHDPAAVSGQLERGPDPFRPLWNETLDPVLDSARPARVLVSLAYLSQLAGAISLARHLDARRLSCVVGGSLPRSLAATGNGMGPLAQVFPDIDLTEGISLVPKTPERFLDRLAWPRILSSRSYLSGRPVLPLTLSTGCYWGRCLFCPDRTLPHHPVPIQAIDQFLSAMPQNVVTRRPVIHLLDSALSPARLKRFLPLARQHGLQFYGFARPEPALYENDLIGEAARSGCLMLQLGTESGSAALLERFNKGIDPDEAELCIRTAAAHGVRTYLYLLFGLPWETDTDRLATLDLIDRCGPAADFLNVSMFNLPRCCELTTRAAQFGITIDRFEGNGDTGGIRLYHPFRCNGTSPRNAARAFLRSRFWPHPAVHAARLRTPKWMRAAHLALMNLPGRR